MIDVWSSMGLRLPRELDFPSDIDLPAEETHFLSLSPHWITSPSSVPGIWAEMSRLARIWSEIQELNKASVDQHLSPLQLQTFVDALAHKLDSWDSNLPPFLVETSQNLEHYSSIGQGTSFAALHLGFHYYNEVLFYQFLAHGDNQPAKAYADRCTRHAAAFCDLLYLCEAIPGCGCLYVMVGHMLTVTSTVYMHVLLFSAEDARIVTARERLQRNFGLLTKLQGYWVILDRALGRLQVFHNACKESIEQSFRMDRWMLGFILEHGTSMPDKFTTPGGCEAGAAAGGTVKDWYADTFS